MEQRTKKLLPDDFIGHQVRETISASTIPFVPERATWRGSGVIPFLKQIVHLSSLTCYHKEDCRG